MASNSQLTSPLRSFRTRLRQVKQDKHRKVWENIFQDQAWAEEAMNFKLNPVLLGPFLGVYYSYRHQSKSIYAYLSIGDATGEFMWKSAENTALFFECLKQHDYEAATQEVKLKDCGITLNISELVTGRIQLVPNKVLSQRCLRLQSGYLFWKDKSHALRKVRSRDIHGLPNAPLADMSHVSDTCEFHLTDPDGY